MQSRSPKLISEIFPLSLSETNWLCFSTVPAITDCKLGRQVAYRCTYCFPNFVVVWAQGTFLAATTLSTSGTLTQLSNLEQWQEVLDQIATELEVDIGWRYTVARSSSQPNTLAELAAAILTQRKPFNGKLQFKSKASK